MCHDFVRFPATIFRLRYGACRRRGARGHAQSPCIDGIRLVRDRISLRDPIEPDLRSTCPATVLDRLSSTIHATSHCETSLTVSGGIWVSWITGDFAVSPGFKSSAVNTVISSPVKEIRREGVLSPIFKPKIEPREHQRFREEGGEV